MKNEAGIACRGDILKADCTAIIGLAVSSGAAKQRVLNRASGRRAVGEGEEVLRLFIAHKLGHSGEINLLQDARVIDYAGAGHCLVVGIDRGESVGACSRIEDNAPYIEVGDTMVVMLDESKVAVSAVVLGTVAGVQFEAVLQEPLPGTAFQVALPA